MRLYIEGPVNKYYVQTLCMIFSPARSFRTRRSRVRKRPHCGSPCNGTPSGQRRAASRGRGVTVRAKLCSGEQAEAERSYPYREGYTRERMEKIAVGDAVTNVCETLRGYRPAWGC